MLSNNLIEFYNDWNNKANQIQGDDLHHIYDKYITLYIIFNCLYNQIPRELEKRGLPMPIDRLYDKKTATEYVVKFLGGSRILDELNDNEEDINTLVQIIDDELFYIKLKYGERQRNEDLKILAGLQSTSPKKKATAILQVIYYVRCNMFHWHKGFKEYQRLLIQPLSNILIKLNQLIFSELNR